MKIPRLLSALILCLLVLPSSGCFLFSDDIEPIYEIDEDDFLVVHPMKDPEFPRSAWDSPTGHDLALRASAALNVMAEFNVVPYEKVMELMYVAPKEDDEGKSDDVGLDVRTLSERQLADLVGADYVLVCKILRFRTKDPLNVNMTQGTATIECNLFRVAKSDSDEEAVADLNERELRVQRARERIGLGPSALIAGGGKYVARAVVTVKFPDDYLNQYGEAFLDEKIVREKLMDKAAADVSKLLYEHEPDDVPGSGA